MVFGFKVSHVVHPYPRPVKLSQEAVVRPSRKRLALFGVVFLLTLVFMDGIWSGTEADTLAHLDLINGLPTGGATRVGMFTLLVTKAFTNLTSVFNIPLWVSFRLVALFFVSVTVYTLYNTATPFIAHPMFWPIRFPFGGEAAPRAYQKSYAMVAALLLLCAFGWIVHRYENSADMGILAVGTLYLYGLVCLPKRHGHYAMGAAIALANTTAISTLGLCLAIVTCLLLCPYPRRILKVLRVALSATILMLITVLLAGGWNIVCSWGQIWLSEWSMSLEPWVWLLKNGIWFLCPLWPGAIAMLYLWRHEVGKRPLRMPLLYTLLLLLAMSLVWGNLDPNITAMLLLPPLTLFAALAIVSIKTGKRHLLDWFGIMIPSLALLVLWLYWGAWVLGWPTKMAKTVSRLAPDALPSFGIPVLVGVAGIIVWIVIVAWRLTHRPNAIWYGAWVTSVGLALTVMTAIAIYQPAIEANRSYAPIAKSVYAALSRHPTPDLCLDITNVPARQRALLLEAEPRLPMQLNLACAYRLIRTHDEAGPQPGALGPFKRPHTDESFWILHQR